MQPAKRKVVRLHIEAGVRHGAAGGLGRLFEDQAQMTIQGHIQDRLEARLQITVGHVGIRRIGAAVSHRRLIADLLPAADGDPLPLRPTSAVWQSPS